MKIEFESGGLQADCERIVWEDCKNVLSQCWCSRERSRNLKKRENKLEFLDNFRQIELASGLKLVSMRL